MRGTSLVWWFGLLVAVAVIPVAIVIDPVLSGFLIYISIFFIAFYSASLKSRLSYVAIGISVNIASAFFLHHSTKIGWQTPTLQSMAELLMVLAIPLVVAMLLACVGLVRKRLLDRTTPR